MRIRSLASRASLACTALIFVTMASASSAASSEDSESNSDGTCVVYSEISHPEAHTLDVHLANTCTRSMACNVAWTVTCGKSARVTQHGAVLGGTAEQTWVASAESCTDDWSIDTSWSCKPSK
jgi:hypothetical protein